MYLAEQEELKKIRQEIQEETQKTEQREQEIAKKSCGKRNKRLKEKHCWKGSGKKRRSLREKKKQNFWNILQPGKHRKNGWKKHKKTAKEELDDHTEKTDGSTGGA